MKRIRSDIGQCIDATRPILGVCFAAGPDKDMLEYHAHPRGQLAYASSGILKVYTDQGIWVIPQFQAVWIPGGMSHSVYIQTVAEIRHLFVDPSYLSRLPRECSVLEVSPLLQALILRFTHFEQEYDIDSPEARLGAVILDELEYLKPSTLYLPWAKDRRVQKVMNKIINEVQQVRSHTDTDYWIQTQNLEKWAQEVGASSRTLSRLFLQETGMTFKQWRRQLILQEAISLLSKGKTVTDVALTLGYLSPSAFISMFRKSLGKSPAQYHKM
jgi:AraC-like DNA-binding protein